MFLAPMLLKNGSSVEGISICCNLKFANCIFKKCPFHCSRDTTVKLWSCLSGKELKNMGGHTGQVTAVCIVDESCSNDLSEFLFCV